MSAAITEPLASLLAAAICLDMEKLAVPEPTTLRTFAFCATNLVMNWPPLPTTGFLTGRSANVEDIDQGNAVFCQQSDDRSRSAHLEILVPQYALWHTEDGDVPSMLVQAELHIHDPAGGPLFGLRTFDGDSVVANGSEVDLLGPVTPSGKVIVR